MGNTPSEAQRDQRGAPREEAKCLNDLPRTFSRLYNSVMSLVEATIAQQEYVDQLNQISTAEAMADVTKLDALTKGRFIIDNLQASRYIHTTSVQDDVMDLYHNIQAILEKYQMKQFWIDSPYLQPLNSMGWNRHVVLPQNQAIGVGLAKVVSNEMHQKETEKLENKILKLKEKMRNLKDDDDKKCSKIRQLENELKQKITLTNNLQELNEKLFLEIENMRPPAISGIVQLFHSHSGNTIKDIEQELKTLLKKHLKDVDFIKCTKTADIDQSQMLIVLSIIASRVGTDAANAIKDVPRPEKTALLLFHIKESHALTKQPSTAVLTDRSFKDLGGIFDMAFVNGKGLYQCEMNDNATENVCDFIKRGISGTGV